jgi:MFS transporter, DHA2 family, multidrug resistance protein
MPDCSPAMAALPPGFGRTMLLVTTLLVSVMAALDLTIVSVALPYMAGGLNATPDTITWVVTMYTVGQALTVGVTGLFSRRLGRKRLAAIAVVGFVGSSAFCGVASSLGQMVVFRFIQGLFSGPLIPLSQSLLVDAYPVEERSKALSYWSMGVMGGPAIGPMLGGYLAQSLNWRWNFYINLPIGFAALLLVLRFVRAVPPRREPIDWTGLGLLLLFVVGLQVMLDQGNTLDWFGSRTIVLLTILWITAGTAFVSRGIMVGDGNAIKLRLLLDWNFTVCALLITAIGVLLLADLVLAPQLYVDIFSWEVVTAGYVIGAAGCFGFLSAGLAGRLVPIFGVRRLVIASCLTTAAGWYCFSRQSLDTGAMQALLPPLLIVAGIQLAFSPLAAQAFFNVAAEDRDEAAGTFNLVKTLGFSFGASFASVLVYRGAQRNWNDYVGFINPIRPGLNEFLTANGFHGVTAEAGALLAAELRRQSAMLTMVQAGEVMTLLALALIPLTFFMQKGAGRIEVDRSAAAG